MEVVDLTDQSNCSTSSYSAGQVDEETQSFVSKQYK